MQAFKRLCPPAEPGLSSGDYPYDWCENAEVYLVGQGTDLEGKKEPFGPLYHDVVDPVELVRSEIESGCKRVDYPEGWLRWLDLSGDGVDDLIIEYRATCDGTALHCSSDDGSCYREVYVRLPSGMWRRASLPPDFEVTTLDGDVAISHRWPYCEGEGISQRVECELIMKWSGEQFEVIKERH